MVKAYLLICVCLCVSLVTCQFSWESDAKNLFEEVNRGLRMRADALRSGPFLVQRLAGRLAQAVQLGTAAGLNEAAGDACELPDRALGQCVVLSDCLLYMALLSESATADVGLQLTQERRCGPNSKPKVCCPASGNSKRSLTAAPATTSRFNTLVAGDACALPGGARGECVALPACAQYLALLKERTTTELGLKLTQERRCGLGRNNPKVCCPSATEDSGLNLRTNLNHADYVDELPKPGACGHQSLIGSKRVWNGLPVKNLQKAPWMALLIYKSQSEITWRCGGSIITKRHVLTAAHCIRQSLYVVRVGELDYALKEKEFEPIDFYIKNKIRHEKYTENDYHYDIGILVLDGTIPEDPSSAKFVAPVCLPEPGHSNKKINTFITGWGENGPKGERPTHLLYAYLDILDQDTCKSIYELEARSIDERVFCAGDTNNGRDACNGDSGGPLVGNYASYSDVTYYQFGLISYGYRCTARTFIGIYTNITTFMPWILEKVTGKP